jgi:membrane fusion protein, multidrug efflux system
MNTRPSAKKIAQWGILTVAGIALLLWAGIWLTYRVTHASTNNAFVESDLISVVPLVSGHIDALLKTEGTPVKAGELLAVLDSRDYQADVNVKQAQLAYAEQALVRARLAASRVKGEVQEGIQSARQDIAAAKAGASSAEQALALAQIQVEETCRAATGQLEAARADLEAVQKDYDRMKALYERGSLEKRRLDLVIAQLAGTRAKVTAAEADLARAVASKRQVHIAENQLSSARAQEEKSQAGLALAEIKRTAVAEAENAVKELEAQAEQARQSLASAELKLEHTRITSPVNGVLAKKFVNAGDFVAPGYPVVAVYDQSNIYITANLEESRLAKVKLGESVDIDVDAFPKAALHGEVIEIGQAAGAKFALIPRDNSAGEFTKVVQRVPIKIRLVDYHDNFLRPGLSVTVGIRTGA